MLTGTRNGDRRELEKRILGCEFPADRHGDGRIGDQGEVGAVLLKTADGQDRGASVPLTLIVRGGRW
jgi:hypothetical protein